jgi:glycine cleavage system H protein
MWASAVDSNRWRFGLTAYAVRLLQDVYFLDWTVAESQPVAARDSIGSIESKKAESDLFAAISGTMETINDAVLDDPSLINADPYGDGWLFEIAAAENELDVATGRPRPLMSPESYADHLRDAWEVAQRTIKGQVNQ